MTTITWPRLLDATKVFPICQQLTLTITSITALMPAEHPVAWKFLAPIVAAYAAEQGVTASTCRGPEIFFWLSAPFLKTKVAAKVCDTKL